MADGACEICGGQARVFIDGKEFCSMGCAKKAQESKRIGLASETEKR